MCDDREYDPEVLLTIEAFTAVEGVLRALQYGRYDSTSMLGRHVIDPDLKFWSVLHYGQMVALEEGPLLPCVWCSGPIDVGEVILICGRERLHVRCFDPYCSGNHLNGITGKRDREVLTDEEFEAAFVPYNVPAPVVPYGKYAKGEGPWWAWYIKYLKSSCWKRKRRAILSRARWVCEKCKGDKAAHVHHLSYAHVGDERPEELEAHCTGCHGAAHPSVSGSSTTFCKITSAFDRARSKVGSFQWTVDLHYDEKLKLVQVVAPPVRRLVNTWQLVQHREKPPMRCEHCGESFKYNVYFLQALGLSKCLCVGCYDDYYQALWDRDYRDDSDDYEEDYEEGCLAGKF